MSHNSLRVNTIIKESIVDGPGLRYTIFTQGCYHNCYKCHNPQTHDYNKNYTLMSIDEIMSDIKSNSMIDGITFTGGEPFMQAESLKDLAIRIHQETNLSILCYTGYTWSQLMNIVEIENILENYSAFEQLLKNIDYLIDGLYIDRLKTMNLKFRGSSNQNYIDVNESLYHDKMIIVPEECI